MKLILIVYEDHRNAGPWAAPFVKQTIIFLTTSLFTHFNDHNRKCVPSIPFKTYF
jgi:hypothetical protein